MGGLTVDKKIESIIESTKPTNKSETWTEIGILPADNNSTCDETLFLNHNVRDEKWKTECYTDPGDDPKKLKEKNKYCKDLNTLEKREPLDGDNFNLTFKKQMIKPGEPSKYSLIFKRTLEDTENIKLVAVNSIKADKIYMKVGEDGELCDIKRNSLVPNSSAAFKFFDKLKTQANAIIPDTATDCNWKTQSEGEKSREEESKKYTYDHCAEWGYKNTNDGDEKPPKIPLPPNEITGKSEGNYMVMCETDANIEDCNRWKYCIKEKEMSLDSSGWGDNVLNKERKKEVSPSATTMTAQQSAKNQIPIDQNAPPHKFDETGGSRPLTEGKMYEIMNDLLVSHRMPVSAFILNGSKGLQKPGPGNPQPYDSTFSVF